MLGAFTCPYCNTDNACNCSSCAPYIKEGEYVNKWTEDGNFHICGKCGKIYSPDQSLDAESKKRKQLLINIMEMDQKLGLYDDVKKSEEK